ncbi:MAG: serine/threonine protein kinase [Deltaproteobacteria bacterium]|nr:MAG: serine/threonine protein kinase [Deltaproteobacteria bacterium]
MKSCWKCGSSVPDTYRYCLACGADVDAGPRGVKDPWIGRTIVGKYRLDDVLGSGAMGTIYKAEQTSLGKEIVIKLLHRHLLGDPELTQRFQREARAASRLNHPNCVQIIDFGQTDDGSLYIAMEYIPGDDLATLLEREFPIDLRRLVHIFKQVCLALDEAHANGVLHRDLKPENIMVADRRNETDFVKVVDFGIAKLEDNNPNSRRSFQTRTGIVCGTPEYMSPEQARGKELDARSDIYALGVALYHLTTDRLPFDAPSPVEIVTKHLTEDPVPPRELQPDLPPAFERLILAMMAKDRDRRPSSVLDVYAELERIDRDLAVARRQQIKQKTHDDATIVDMHPSALIQAAILDATGKARDEPTQETTARPEGIPARASAVVSHKNPTAMLPSEGLDTLQENGVALDGPKMRAAAAKRKNKTAPRGPARRRPDASLAGDKRGQITVNTPPVSGGASVSAPAPAATSTSDDLAIVAPRGRKTAMVITISLAVAAVLGLTAWILVTVLQD